MAKVQIIKRYDDTILKDRIFEGRILEVDDNRAAQLVGAGVAVKLVETVEAEKPVNEDLKAPLKTPDEFNGVVPLQAGVKATKPGRITDPIVPEEKVEKLKKMDFDPRPGAPVGPQNEAPNAETTNTSTDTKTEERVTAQKEPKTKKKVVKMGSRKNKKA